VESAEFVRWKNEPPQTNSGAKRLICVNAEGLNEVRSEAEASLTIFSALYAMSTNGIAST
jgi:hypothetical protein